MSSDKTPSVRFRRIGRTLRELRENAGLTLTAAGRRLERSAASLSTIETGAQPIRPRDLAYILDRYDVGPGALRESLLHLARQGRKKDWTHSYEGRISPAGLDYASIEADSAMIRDFQLYLISGLLQTEEYATALMGTRLPTESHDNAQLVEFRMTRQKILLSEDPPLLVAIVGEAALRQEVGGRIVMRAQLDRLIDVIGNEHINLRVLPYSAGVQPSLDGSFTIFDLRAPGQLSVVAVEDLTRISFRERDEEAAVFASAFARLSAAALDKACSLALLSEYGRRHERDGPPRCRLA